MANHSSDVRVPMHYQKYMKSIELRHRFSRPWKLNFTKMYIKYWKSMEIPNSAV